MKINDFEIFKFADNDFRTFYNPNDGSKYNLNRHPYLDIVLTDHCNANCNFCIADLIHDKLTCNIDIFKRKIKFAVDIMGTNDVLLLGGEPTTSKNLIPLIEWLTTLKLDKIIMTTNGIRLAYEPDYRKKVLSSGLTNINISFMSIAERLQSKITNSKKLLTTKGLKDIYQTAQEYGVKLRINNNIFLGNNDTISAAIHFYSCIKDHCDSIKFSPLFEVDNFSVIDIKTEWVKNNRLNNIYTEELFFGIENFYAEKYNLSIIENDLQFGFVKNTMIPLKVPIIMNWNFGKYTGMMEKVTKHKQINNLKLLPNNELSLSWNREASEYFINS